jgi:cbb3-type cytochrome oxidase subunit 3
MTYAALESALVWVWAAWGLVLLGFILWAVWVFALDEPRAKRRRRREADALLARIQPRVDA